MAEVTDYEQVARAEIEEVNRDAGNNPVKVGILTPLTGPGDPVVGEVAKLAMIDKVTAVLGQWHLRTAPYAAELCERRSHVRRERPQRGDGIGIPDYLPHVFLHRGSRSAHA
jgi:hypothetical protein